MESTEYLRRMKRCAGEQMDLSILLDEFTYLIINDIHNSSNLPVSYIFLSIAVALCHWANGTHLKGINHYNIPLILFGILCGGSGKLTFILLIFLRKKITHSFYFNIIDKRKNFLSLCDKYEFKIKPYQNASLGRFCLLLNRVISKLLPLEIF
jgi:hypothetical protein